MVRKEFKVYSPLTAKSVKSFTHKSEDSEDRILLEGVASTTSRDLHDEIVSSSAIESMSEQALELNIHGDHWYGLDDVIGAIKDATVEDKQLKIKFLITKKYTPDIKDLLETGVRLGLSIGGYVTAYDEKNRIINEIELHEISLTAMPANWDTFGTVTTSKGLVESTCIAGACHAIVKNLGEQNMTSVNKEEQNQEEETSGLTRDEVIELINEYMAEKEETISQEITEKVESQLEAIVEAKVQELIDEEPPEEPPADEDETKAADEEEEEPDEDEDENEDEDETKSFNPEDISKAINEGIANALGDDFVEKVASKMFGNFDKQRTTEGSKYEQYMKTIEAQKKEESAEPPVEKNTFSTRETAEILMRKQQTANPIMAAVMKQLD